MMLGCFTRFVDKLDRDQKLRKEFTADPDATMDAWNTANGCTLKPHQRTLLKNILPPNKSTTDADINNEITAENAMMNPPPMLTHVGLSNKLNEGT